MNDKPVPSPDGAHMAALIYAGEIRFGPPYFRLSIDGHPLGERLFGERVLWSDDSTLFAAEEWMTAEEARGPRTRLAIFDVVGGREWATGVAEGGFMEPVSFRGRNLVFDEAYYGRGTKVRHDCELLPPDEWPPGRWRPQTGE